MESLQRRSPSQRPRRRWFRRPRHLAKTLFDRFPRLGRAFTRMWRIAKYPVLRYQDRLSAFLGRRAGTYVEGIDADRVFFVSPESIEYCSLRGFNIRHFKGRVVPGDWDRLEKRFKDLDVYVAFREVFLEGLDWPDTVYYQRNIEIIESGHIRWGCRDRAEFDQRCRKLESLFHSIRQDGYKSQEELASSTSSLDSPVVLDNEVIVSIGRNGDLLFSDGAHRLAIAKLLGIESIPVAVAARHPEWLACRERLIQSAEEGGGLNPRLRAHPDLVDVLDLHADEED